jgi:hypothetical protein
MRLVRLTWFYDFMQILRGKRKPSTKNEYFPMPILFSTIYLLQEQELNSRIYSKQEINYDHFCTNY